MLDKKKKRSSSVSRVEWPENGGGGSQPPQVSDRKTDLEKLYWGDGGAPAVSSPSVKTYQTEVQVERFYWNDKVPGGEARPGTEQGEQTKERKPKLNGLREFQNFNDEEKLY